MNTTMTILDLRKKYHEEICKHLLRIRKNSKKGDYPNNADGDSKISIKIAQEIVNRTCPNVKYGNISGQTAGKLFEALTKNFIVEAFNQLYHLYPAKWNYYIEMPISEFEQYRDLAEVETELKKQKNLERFLVGIT